MKIRYYVRKLTDEGRLVEAPSYYETSYGFPWDGYDTESEAEEAIKSFFRNKAKYEFIGIDLLIVKLYMEGDSDD